MRTKLSNQMLLPQLIAVYVREGKTAPEIARMCNVPEDYVRVAAFGKLRKKKVKPKKV